MKTTLSVIKADIGSLAGHHVVHPDTIAVANKVLAEAKRNGLIIDYYITYVGDDLQLIMTHSRGELDSKVHETAWNAFKEAAKTAKELGLYAAGQDLLSDSFSGNLKGMGPGIAEIEFDERPSEPLAIFMADKTEPGAYNLPLYKMFADPFNTAGLVIDPTMHDGFKFEVLDVYEGESIILNTPEETYDLLALIGTPSRYIVRRVYRKSDNLQASVVSVERLNLIAGKYVGKDDPVMIVRVQHGLPALGEVLEAFTVPYLVPGWMRGSHYGPIMPVSQRDARATRFDGPPRLIGLGFNVKNGKLVGPTDLFDDPAFDEVRRTALLITDYMRRHGPFMPHRLEPQEMEYTTLPLVIEKLKNRFKKESDMYKVKPSVYSKEDSQD
ncbi:fructose 1,6-bisphosphatase [Sulfolobus sp. A20]|uniref:fructose-1,6-bisphosphate aldolase/phosphatase n=1 Tax=Sulfolobaceae TaxID=118883 RepID=UPI000845F58B|nr:MULTISPECIES: fructose-1,6-bisphosphate aldolase/phosphatase [unclassified Sulfolobus]TRM77068.1 fructose 1,6-bisphosphatase [Sulfolobus sp. B5]TRM77784.1 fructose 1,6-bisphosphatase [Sulfolobus sp. A20-N-F8]TRM80939.1 fructose 1,6-bisphosphatase [Sulfolobus sp. D5]TRM83906.1 fructose 1,6-bisphosphatase [Sulfolobus sp. A20-N-F6]TRM86827.1 fructose 1,6-bisphosphatase [Sulfolobus sp. E3]TRM88702.1 fructose 1,6-bisphosphatase [Sulfolobus sp. C3]TRM94749.1 fructose 1,6-bisphosphatase [Sulfolo